MTTQPGWYREHRTNRLVEAIRWTAGGGPAATDAVVAWITDHHVVAHHRQSTVGGETVMVIVKDRGGNLRAQPGDWIVRRDTTWEVTPGGVFDAGFSPEPDADPNTPGEQPGRTATDEERTVLANLRAKAKQAITDAADRAGQLPAE